MKPQRALGKIAKTKAETLGFGSRCAFSTHSDFRSLFTRIHRIPSYNQAGLLTQTTNAMGHPATYAYDAANPSTSTTNRDGRTITYAYDQAGRITGETWLGGSYTATFVYNKDGMVTKAQDPNSVYTYAYNADSQVTSVDNAGTSSVPTVTLSLAYDGYQNLTSVSDSLGGIVTYSYNGDNQLSSLALSLSSTLDAQVTFAYDEANRLTGITRSGGHNIVSSLSYDNANRLTDIKTEDMKSLQTLANYTYAYNKGGELTSYQDNSSNSLSYSYDPDGELTGATGTLLSQSYTFTYDYDKNGNRTSTSTDIGGSLTSAAYSTGSGNELLNDGTYTYTYDNDGNMLTQTNLTSGSVTYYSWDYENRLTEVEEKTSSSGTVIYDEKYTYDVNGNRIGVSNNGTQELYTVYLGSNPYIDFNGSGTLTERYLFNPQSLNVFYGQVSGSGTTEWFLTDNINSIRQVVSATGSVLNAITYDPYGNILNQTSLIYEPRFLYAGGAYDSNTGDYQFNARPYSAGNGRFEAQDPLSFTAGDPDLYRYVFNSPLNTTDPSGMNAPGGSLGIQLGRLASVSPETAAMVLQTLGPPAAVISVAAAAKAYEEQQKQWIRQGPNLLAMSVGATTVSMAVGRGLDAILADDDLFGRWLNRPHPISQPLSPDDAAKVWDKLLGLGKKPRLDPGHQDPKHPGRKWTGPHINVDGTHIPVDPGFNPPPPPPPPPAP